MCNANYFSKFGLVSLIFVTVSGSAGSTDTRVDVRTETDLLQNGGTTTCFYNHSEPGFCKSGVPDLPSQNEGYWSSCASSNCLITFRLGSIGNLERVPAIMYFYSYVRGVSAEIRVRYRLTPSSQLLLLEPVLTDWPYWTEQPFELWTIPNLSPDSEIVIRLSSGPDNADVVESMVFYFDDSAPTSPVPPTEETIITTEEDFITTREPSTTSFPVSTMEVPIDQPDIILDLDTDVTDGWINVDCSYKENYEEFTNCGMDVPNPPPGGGRGYWSSCERSYCTIMFLLGRYENPPIPKSITFSSFVSGEGKLEVTVNGKDLHQVVGVISGMSVWTNVTFDLTHLPMDTQAIVNIEPSSDSYPGSIDLIDKIYVTSG